MQKKKKRNRVKRIFVHFEHVERNKNGDDVTETIRENCKMYYTRAYLIYKPLITRITRLVVAYMVGQTRHDTHEQQQRRSRYLQIRLTELLFVSDAFLSLGESHPGDPSVLTRVRRVNSRANTRISSYVLFSSRWLRVTATYGQQTPYSENEYSIIARRLSFR